MRTDKEHRGILLPVTIVTGFLGSGKTTLVNHILSQQHGLRIAVLVNEFGKIGIDQELIVSQEDGIIELNNGCICCTINHDLLDAVAGILERRNQIDYLIVETTGVADPYSIAMTFVGKDLSPYVRLDSIITLVDAENFTDELLKEAAVYNQIKYGDIILLNKSSLVEEERLSKNELMIRSIKDRARILRTEFSNVALPLILDTEAFSPDKLERNNEPHHHENRFMSLSFEFDHPFNLKNLQNFFGKKLPETAYRAKGILWVSGHKERLVFHLTGRRFTIDKTEWNDRDKKNQLVIIGTDLDKAKLTKEIKMCLDVKKMPHKQA